MANNNITGFNIDGEVKKIDYNELTNKPTIPTVPESLKNPNALKFTGAVTGTYDGSTPVTINIPSPTDSDTTYTLSLSGNTLTLTPSKGTAQTVTLPSGSGTDKDTTYSFAITDGKLVITPSSGDPVSLTLPSGGSSSGGSTSGLNIKNGEGEGSIISNPDAESAPHAYGKYSYAEYEGTAGEEGLNSGIGAHAEGCGIAKGNYSHAENQGVASGEGSHAEGFGIANGDYSHAEGGWDYESGWGNPSTSAGSCSHAEGNNTCAAGESAHAEGHYCLAQGDSSHSEGNSTHAYGYATHSQGYHTQAFDSFCNVFGKYNKPDIKISDYDKKNKLPAGSYILVYNGLYGMQGLAKTIKEKPENTDLQEDMYEWANFDANYGKYLEMVGNGTGQEYEKRSNARTLDKDGNEWLAGTVEPVGGLILKSTTANSTKRFLVTVDDTGTLKATEITTA